MDKRKYLLSKINSLKLNIEQYIEIYKIIKQEPDLKIMKNNNGLFVNLNDLSDRVILKIENFISYIISNQLTHNI
tara:strand:+ start:334 stop:558 length:225 start_codon:yes stop_codon:yes gene_type:complete